MDTGCNQLNVTNLWSPLSDYDSHSGLQQWSNLGMITNSWLAMLASKWLLLPSVLPWSWVPSERRWFFQRHTVHLWSKKQKKLTFSDRIFSKAVGEVKLPNQSSPTTSCAQMKAVKDTQMPDFPGDAVFKNPPANAGDTGSSPGPGRSHMPWSN